MEKLQIKLEKWVNGGYTLGHTPGHVVFVEGGIPGELVDITLTKQGNKEWFGVVESIIDPSQLRIPSDCPVYLECGGCSYRHISYEEEVKIKLSLLESMFPQWKGKTEVVVGPSVGYRNNVQWQVEGNQIGFFAKNSHRIIQNSSLVCKNVDKRLLIDDQKSIQKPKFKQLQNPKQYRKTKGHSLSLRLSKDNVINYEKQETEVNVFNTNLKVPTKGFFQINQFLLEDWLQKIKEYLPEGKQVLELFCGCGTIGISLRGQIASLYGIESHAKSIEYAKTNANANGANSFQYVTKDLYQSPLGKELKQYSVWLVNPPRAGLSKGIIDSIFKLKPDTMIYSSCNPSTLRRDVIALEENGYQLDRMSLFDFFPRTNHYEVLVRLQKVK